ncbi:hypothetical protein [Stenotrophomonas muris]|uniref:hypothetical protein n=1 Tax=Stenotrophomonas muris TaxID=2963283 RepID=UPI00383A7B3C
MSDIALNPCPFCGGTAFMVQEDTHAQCLTPGCCVGPVCGLDSWNTRASQWQPIETAPKDGTPVLLDHPDWHMRVMRGAWDQEVLAWHVLGFGYTAKQPTRWQPLPAPPEVEG